MILLAALVVSGCGSSGGSSSSGGGGRDLGALAGVNAIDGKAQRMHRRAKAKAAQVNTSQLRYLDRLAARRTARGLPVPAELRVSYRRARYDDKTDMAKATKSVLAKITNPITRLLPFSGRNGTQPLSNTTATTANTSKRNVMFKP